MKNEGKTFLVSQNESVNTGWRVYGVTEQERLLGQLVQLKWGLAVISVITLLLTLFVSLLLSKNLVKPLIQLKQNMQRVHQGDWRQIEPNERQDEIGHLTRHYNLMLLKLEEFVGRLLEEERKKKDLEFRALRMQINPHFMYNTLNSIKWCIYLEQNDKATEMIDAFVDILKFISKRNSDFISIAEEQSFLIHYLKILEIRYLNQFEVRWDIPESTKPYKIPTMLLQPVVENAIVHGLEQVESQGMIEIGCRLAQDRILITVRDNGSGFDPKAETTMQNKFNAVGLANVRDRLELIYGHDYRFEIESIVGEGSMITFDLPARLDEGEVES